MDAAVWPVARGYSEERTSASATSGGPMLSDYWRAVRKPDTRQESLYNVGLIDYFPSAPNKGIAPEWTSWESYLKKQMNEKPFSASFLLSNAGALFGGGMDGPVLELLPGLRDLIWTQSAVILSGALLIHPVGLTLPTGEGSLSISVVWDKALLSSRIAESFTSGLERTLRLFLAEDSEALSEDVTFQAFALLLAKAVA